MRGRRAIGGALVVFVLLAATACGSSAGHGASPATSPPSTTAHPAVTPTTRHAPPLTTPPNPVTADHLAQFVLTTALNAAKSIYDRTYDFTAVTPASLAPLVPNVKFVALDQASAADVGLLAQDRHDVFFVARSASGRWFCITDNDTDGVSYGTGASRSAVDSNGECQQPAW
jgi:hypothetical protein